MIPWYIWAGIAGLLTLACVVNDIDPVFDLGATAAIAMTTTVALGLEIPVWIEMIILFPALCLILASIAGPRRDSLAVLSDNRSRFTRWPGE